MRRRTGALGTNNSIANLWRNQRALATLDITVEQIETDLAMDMPHPLTKDRDRQANKGLQAGVCHRLKSRVPVVARLDRLRRKLEGHGLPPSLPSIFHQSGAAH